MFAWLARHLIILLVIAVAAVESLFRTLLAADVVYDYYTALLVWLVMLWLYYRGISPFNSEGRIQSLLWYAIPAYLTLLPINSMVSTHAIVWWYPTPSRLWAFVPWLLIGCGFSLVGHFKYGLPILSVTALLRSGKKPDADQTKRSTR